MYHRKSHYFYDFIYNDKEPNCFEITLHSENKKIFLDSLTLYADIYVTNGYLCEKLREGNELYPVENYPINKLVLLNSPSKYLEGIEDVVFYWKSIAYLYGEKLNFFDLEQFIKDLKSIMSIYLEILTDKERGYLLLNSLEEAKINNKSFKMNKNNSISFIVGKEVNLYINSSSIINESITIFSECIFYFLQNLCSINQCISLVMIDNQSKRTLYSCSPKIGTKISI